jgi:hypothetical protein
MNKNDGRGRKRKKNKKTLTETSQDNPQAETDKEKKIGPGSEVNSCHDNSLLKPDIPLNTLCFLAADAFNPLQILQTPEGSELSAVINNPLSDYSSDAGDLLQILKAGPVNV